MTKRLNQQQQDVITAPLQNMLVIAGAGTGKTTTLIERIAYVLQNYGLKPYQILAVTFTNKAAKEIKDRLIERMRDSESSKSILQIMLGTFHSLCIRIMRENYQILKLDPNFKIIDSNEQIKLIRSIYSFITKNSDKLDKEECRNYVALINSCKEHQLRPDRQQEIWSKFFNNLCANERTKFDLFIEIYKEYQHQCTVRSLVDFAETHLAVFELLINNPSIMVSYQQRFKYILVDECQDTNALQYKLLTLLSSHDNYTLMVGDDDQSIYGWRGAVVNNIYAFEQEFYQVKRYKLEYNYRSTTPILDLANQVIKLNRARIVKNLVTPLQHKHVVKPQLVTLFNNYREAEWIVEKIRELQQAGEQLPDIAIIYRQSSLSFVIEQAFTKNSIEYTVQGGKKFIDRKEIITSFAYLRLILDPQDNISLLNTINVPSRKLGDVFINKLTAIAFNNDLSYWDSLDNILHSQITIAQKNAIDKYKNLILQLKEKTLQLDLPNTLKELYREVEIYKSFKSNDSEDHFQRQNNLNELINFANDFIQSNIYENLSEEELNELKARALLLGANTGQEIANTCQKLLFLDKIDLREGSDKAPVNETAALNPQQVNLMTIHSAKGLEFNNVFIVGVEEDIIPNARAVDEQIDEERRLMYVAITRAKKNLFLTHVKNRKNSYDKNTLGDTAITPFLTEANVDNLIEIKLDKFNSTQQNNDFVRRKSYQNIKAPPRYQKIVNDGSLKAGGQAMHQQHGKVTIININSGKVTFIARHEILICDETELTPM